MSISAGELHHQDDSCTSAAPPCPFSLEVSPIARFLNVELSDDPTYDGLELQWFDDDLHGTGMLAFLSRRADRRVDYYLEPGLRVDPAGYEIGGGIGHWGETEFSVARLEVAEDGVVAEVRFTDVEGREVEVRVDDRDGRRRRRAQLLAPVSAGVDRPTALLLVWLGRFDLVRVTSTPPTIRIGGHQVSTGRLPGARLHRRHLIKYAAPLCAVGVNRGQDGPLPPGKAGQRVELTPDRSGITAVGAEHGGHRARVDLDPALPDVRALADGAAATGHWHVSVDGARVTGGAWLAQRRGDQVALGLDVTQRWRPGPLPWLMRLVTTLVPVFRRWPTTYRWRAVVQLGETATMASHWERTAPGGATGYRRWTRS
ncbi:hypothetical protein [Rhodococcus sp. X156]|uniref:hypothetical protein n=1 Tax=Rhodococcus sp. X156 TaxID=2499145 RepID=UPI000FDC747E|nr:hypothetical protein [Rhodococcus sp. X156]